MLKFLLFIFINILFYACEKINLTQKKNIISLPTSELKKLKFYSYNKEGQIKVVVSGLSGFIFRKSKEIILTKLKMLFFFKKNNKPLYVELFANKGKFNYETFNCEAWGNAVIIKKDEVRIEADQIYWNNKQKKFYTKNEIEVLVFKFINPKDFKDNSIVKTSGKNLIADYLLKVIELDEGTTLSSDIIWENNF